MAKFRWIPARNPVLLLVKPLLQINLLKFIASFGRRLVADMDEPEPESEPERELSEAWAIHLANDSWRFSDHMDTETWPHLDQARGLLAPCPTFTLVNNSQNFHLWRLDHLLMVKTQNSLVKSLFPLDKSLPVVPHNAVAEVSKIGNL